MSTSRDEEMKSSLLFSRRGRQEIRTNPLRNLAFHNNMKRKPHRNTRNRIAVLLLFLMTLLLLLYQLQLSFLHKPSDVPIFLHRPSTHFARHERTTKAINNDFYCSMVKHHLRQGGKVLLYNFTSPSNGPGMASLTLNMMQLSMFFHERWNRTFTVIDEDQLRNYRWNKTHGLYSGFLKPNLCVLDRISRASFFKDAQVCNYWDMKCQVLEIPADPVGLQFTKARRVTKRYYFKKKKAQIEESESILNTRFFHDLSTFMCSQTAGFRIAPHAGNLVQDILERSRIPVSNIGLAFHIRRGDKVAGGRKESRSFHSSEYIERFLNQSSLSSLGSISDFGDCFVATDDYDAVVELDEALRKHRIPCQKLWTLTSPGYNSTWQVRDEIVSFLSQLVILARSEYFVGSFQSNVGAMVALLRGCYIHANGEGGRGGEENRFNHYFHSYGVDWDEWGFI